MSNYSQISGRNNKNCRKNSEIYIAKTAKFEAIIVKFAPKMVKLVVQAKQIYQAE